jgi:hypothetical protein
MNNNDISIIDTSRGGDLEFYREDFTFTAGLRNNIYLCLFGGNVEQTSDRQFRDGEERFDWWGNELLFSNDPQQQFNSRTEKALRESTASSAGRAEIKAAILKDLSPLSDVGEIEAEVILQALDKVLIKVSITERDTDIVTELEYLWDAAREEENERSFRDNVPPDRPPAETFRWNDGQGNDFTDGLGNKFTYK